MLTLTAPKALEEELLDLLREQTDLASGFSVLHGYGLGAGATLVSPMERVQGRAQRVVVQLLMQQADVAALIARLSASLKSHEVAYWAVPVLTAGRLA